MSYNALVLIIFPIIDIKLNESKIFNFILKSCVNISSENCESPINCTLKGTSKFGGCFISK